MPSAPSPSHHHKFIGGINLPFSVTGGKHGMVFPTDQVSWWSGLAAPPLSAARFAARHFGRAGGLLYWPPVKEDPMEGPMENPEIPEHPACNVDHM
jgi:hypothetical protein